ncbi:DUF4336 domain-containing protein [Pseudodonghicola flavimaris]|uniref:DUF4336 domain-containing protein n=1 Tax=Pseudodonghicola flavimaris TaxID=3050036 RepID=A0ABT7F1M3_9RHOB|nr:DUF4336 domain-containing protein [Pseudodonghicola flavimaris]MDK3018505.1 DUF4336 domain-containing protein [Pseudodonghicola flavimaris]
MTAAAPLLQPLGRDLWLAAGPEVTVLGFRYPTRMAVIRLSGGGLLIWSPVALSDPLCRAIRDLGPVQEIVAPNRLHHLSLLSWHQAFPGARLHAAPGLPEKRRDIPFDRSLGEAPDPAWAADLDQVLVRGNLITPEAVFFHRATGTVLFTDLLQGFAPGWFSGWRQAVARLDGMVGPEPAVPRKFRLAFQDRKIARAGVARILDWRARQLVMAHGPVVTQEVPALLSRAFRWLGA